MRYTLSEVPLGLESGLSISEAQFEDIKSARLILHDCLALEETFHMLNLNYLEFERQVLDAAISGMAQLARDYSSFFGVRLPLNVALVNLLTCARMYLDQLVRHICVCAPLVDNPKDWVDGVRSTEYDTHMEYRFMEALRNHVQHYGLPVHRVSCQADRKKDGSSSFVECTADVYTIKDYLSRSGSFKKAVLSEVPEEIDLKVTTRSYMDSLHAIHRQVRNIISGGVSGARRVIQSAIDLYAESVNADSRGLCTWATDSGEIRGEVVPVLLDWDEVRVELQEKNVCRTNIARSYVAGRSSAARWAVKE